MAPYFRTIKSFADVPQSDAGVDTLAFLDASKGVVGIFELLESTVLTVVSNDLSGNIAKVKTRYDAAPEKSQTLEELVTNEIGEKKKTATQGLVWLIRGLSFTCKALQATQNDPSLGLSKAFQGAYGDTLKPHHSVFVRPVFSAAMSACPTRDTLYTKLSEDKELGTATTASELNEDLNSWLASLYEIILRIEAFFEKTGFGKGF